MKIILATGIYPPDIGGPATYCRELAHELSNQENTVTVVTYGNGEQQKTFGEGWEVVSVSKSGGPLMRWWRYMQALRNHGVDADIVYAFSSVSCGIPLLLSRLQKPRKILRLGGDFLWERYTDQGGQKTLREWYEDGFYIFRIGRYLMAKLLRTFDHIVFSTAFQQAIYEKHFSTLPSHSVIENALPVSSMSQANVREKHVPFKLLFMGRYVGFKNLFNLLKAMTLVQGISLTMVGDGPLAEEFKLYAEQCSVPVTFLSPVTKADQQGLFAEHDGLILPSLTEISPNTALEAVAAGLPVLLTQDHGLSDALKGGMLIRPLRTPEEITKAIQELQQSSITMPTQAARSWTQVAIEHRSLFERLVVA